MSLDLSVDALRRARGREVTFVLTSDAHHSRELDRVRFAALNAERAWTPPERVANAWPAERLAAWARGDCDAVEERDGAHAVRVPSDRPRARGCACAASPKASSI